MIGSLATLSLSLFLAQHVVTPPPPAPPPPPSAQGGLPEYALLDAVRRVKLGGSGAGIASLPDGADFQVNSTSSSIQADAVIVVDPNDRKHIVGAANDTRAGYFQCVYYASFDAGATWVENYFPDPDGFGNALSPALAFGPGGVIYYAANAYDVNTQQSGMYVGTTTDGGQTIGNWVQAIGPGASHTDDKPALAVDNTPGGLYLGHVYLTFTRFGIGGVSPIMISTSTDGGATWTYPKQFSDDNVCQGSAPIVGLNGEVFCCFYDFVDNTIKFDASYDGGTTWGTDVQAGKGKYLTTVPNTTFHTNSIPQMDIDRSGGAFGGTLYMTFCCDKNKGTLSDVYVSHSYDGGATWSRLYMVNDFTGNSQFFPALSCDSTGHVNVGWMDRRDDPTDVSIKYYVSRSSDGGITWDPNVAASDTSFDPNSYPQGNYIGDYTGITSSERLVYAAWTDGRNGNDDVYASPVNLDFYTDANYVSAAVGGTVNFFVDSGSIYSFMDYRLLGSVTGTSPGIKLNGTPIPLNFDQFMMLTIIYGNSASFPGFFGTLGYGGTTSASMVFPTMPPSLIGLQFDFAAFVKVNGKCRWASAASHLVVVP